MDIALALEPRISCYSDYEKKGYLRSTEERDGRSRRKVYRATPLGSKDLASAKRKVRELLQELIEEGD